MVPNELIIILVRFGFICEVNGYRVSISRVELPDCIKTYNYYDLASSFKDLNIFATFCSYTYRISFKREIDEFLIESDRERKINDLLECQNQNQYQLK